MGRYDSEIQDRDRVDEAYEYNGNTNPGNQKYPGKEKCEKLRQIRKLIAEVNGIRFEPDVCHHEGPCAGTCPACDAEIRYLDELLQLKKQRGEEVILSGLSLDIGNNASEETPVSNDLVDGNLSIDSDIDGEDTIWDTDEDDVVTMGKVMPPSLKHTKKKR